MKQRLLITIGCSFTEGEGCWDMNLKYPKNFSNKHNSNYYFKQLNKSNFHANGWPNKLGKKLGFDKVINLGLGGASTSSNIKYFFKYIVDIDFSEYEVSIIWLITDSYRISIIKDGVINSVNPSGTLEEKELYNSVYKFVSQNGFRSEMETLFDYISEEYLSRKILKSLCKDRGWNFVSFHLHANDYSNILQHQIYGDDKTHCFTQLAHFEETSANRKKYISPFCGHFNELGYELMSQDMYEFIKRNHNYMIGNSKSNIDWVYLGNGKLLDNNVIIKLNNIEWNLLS